MKLIYNLMLASVLIFTQSSCANEYHNNLNSVLWVQTSSEYHISTIQTYKNAANAISIGLKNKKWSALPSQVDKGNYENLKPAIIMDIDETILDNSSFNAQLIIDEEGFSSSAMDEWMSLSQAKAVPGAIEFVRNAVNSGIEVFYITNRICSKRGRVHCPQKEDTIRNMKKLGFPVISNTNALLLMNERPEWTSEKKSRREFVSKSHRIILIIGDDVGDFIDGVKYDITPEQRIEITSKYETYWGERWFILPNPIYGSWNSILNYPKKQYLRGIEQQNSD